MKRVLGLLLVLLAWVVPIAAQQTVVILPLDADDASIATGQTNSNVNALSMAYDGSVWRRLTFGTAGTASAQVLTVQGIASMTPLLVNGSAVTQPISAASLPLPALASTSTKQSDGSQKTQLVDGSGNVIASTSNALNVACANCQIGAAATATLTNVASSATNVTCLASNASRLGVNLYNDSTQVVYLKFGTTASATSYTLQMSAGAYWSMSGLIYTGRIDCIWASANGNARVTELTP